MWYHCTLEKRHFWWRSHLHPVITKGNRINWTERMEKMRGVRSFEIFTKAFSNVPLPQGVRWLRRILVCRIWKEVFVCFGEVISCNIFFWEMLEICIVFLFFPLYSRIHFVACMWCTWKKHLRMLDKENIKDAHRHQKFSTNLFGWNIRIFFVIKHFI